MKKRTYIAALVVLFLVSPLGLSEVWAQCTDKDDVSCENTNTAEINIPEDDVLVPDNKIEAADSVDSWFSTGFNELSLNKLNFILPSFIRLTPQSKLDGTLKWALKGISVLSLEADATITGIRLSHPRLATQPVIVTDARIKGIIRWNRSAKTVTFENFSVGRQDVMALVNGTVGYSGPTTMNLKIALPSTDLQSAFNALPGDLIPRLKGAQVQGKIALNTVISIDPANPQDFQFEPGIRISEYSLIEAPPKANVSALKGDYTHEVHKNGLTVRRIQLSPEYSFFVPYDQLEPTVIPAILKAEDAGFFNHNGFDLEAMRAAMVSNLAKKGQSIRGGSTITMQLVKNLFLDPQKTISRKIEESMITFALEKELDKKRILEIYANIIEWGDNVYGISEAANHYFKKKVSELTPAEAAQLAGIIPNPRNRDFNKKEIILY